MQTGFRLTLLGVESRFHPRLERKGERSKTGEKLVLFLVGDIPQFHSGGPGQKGIHGAKIGADQVSLIAAGF